MPELPRGTPEILQIYLQIAQYPILAQRIRQRMRLELFQRGVITPQRLEEEACERAEVSQRREGMTDPLAQEDAAQWAQRVALIRDYLTDFYFAYNLPVDQFHQVLEEVLGGRAAERDRVGLTFNPELAPRDLLLAQLAEYEALPELQRSQVQHHIEEIRVVLIKMLISDQLRFVRLAQAWFTSEDFRFILAHHLGTGKIGGKAAGMLLARKILKTSVPDLAQQIEIPRSYFVGADLFYDFLALNGLEYLNQKYKSPEQIRQEYPQIQEAYSKGKFPAEFVGRLGDTLRELQGVPVIVRSSSLLEDSYGTSFAGKYASFFCANQGSAEENLERVLGAIRRIYASVFSPDAMIYRRRMGLLDYDERMAILLQEVEGQTYQRYFFPPVAGVAFSRSPIVWDPRIRREDGFTRLVLGLGTRAVEQVASDYPRMVMLSHPLLRPETSPAQIRHFSQQHADLIDLDRNEFVTLPIGEVLHMDYPGLRWVASIEEEGTLLPLYSLGSAASLKGLVLTFDSLLAESDFIPLLRSVLKELQVRYGMPVDMEFALALHPRGERPKVVLRLLQCRPQSGFEEGEIPAVPEGLPAERVLFTASAMVPRGLVSGVEYLVYVEPQAYERLVTSHERMSVAGLVGRLNSRLEGHPFILIGPGRWGSSNLELGVGVTYGDIYNARALVELAVPQRGIVPDPSLGTHFFQDLYEARVFPLVVFPGRSGDSWNPRLIETLPNVLETLLPGSDNPASCLRVVEFAQATPPGALELVMDGQRAVAYLEQR